LPYSFVLLLVGACATGHEVARKGRQLIIGMDASALQDCAGIPTRTKQLDPRTELYSYENHYEHTGGVQITLPIIGGGFSVGGSAPPRRPMAAPVDPADMPAVVSGRERAGCGASERRQLRP
jgi:hypothetical protein